MNNEEIILSSSLANLHWYKLPVTLINIWTSPAMKAEPFSIMQAILKEATFSLVQKEYPTLFSTPGKKTYL